MKVQISISLKSFDMLDHSYATRLRNSTKTLKNSNSLRTLPLPKTRTLYTVLRSPHIDKKSREQFEMKINKQLIIINTELHKIRDKIQYLKFHEIAGVQMKIIFRYKTRLSGLKKISS
jgi:small subunit ribosomal protein S10